MKTGKISNQRWRSILRRDPTADGQFVFAVRSTGIYCRPSCPARRPKRRNIEFFLTPNAAEQQGYRACRRCHPREDSAPDAQILRTCRLIETNLETGMSLSALAAKIGLSRFHLLRKFKQALGLSPREYADVCRFRSFKKELKQGPSITSAVYAAGYGSSSRVYERTPSRLGMTPACYRQGGSQTRIYYATVKCSLGRLLVAATERGICAVSLGEDDKELLRSLREEFPSANLSGGGSKLAGWILKIIRHLAGAELRLDLPLDIRATAFQYRVWSALQKIPYGKTQSYSQIARSIGSPKAVRAVARACATNPAALIIPCHRVIRETGQLAGYRWGLPRKQALIATEQALVNKSSRRRSPNHHGRTPPPAPA